MLVYGTQIAGVAIVPLTHSRSLSSDGKFTPPQAAAPIHTDLRQHVATAHTWPTPHSAVDPQLGRPRQGVEPSTQKPVPSVVLAQTQLPPGPQAPKLSHVWPAQKMEEQAPFVQTLPDGH